ncbi:MAG: protoheme IX farnesyltransferase [Gammaproteobacteria bacterium]|nr:protoheme IX farnesyltransferase [Gammaproteobacteria bacterium]
MLNNSLKQYYQLTKPGVVALIVFTAIVGMLLSTPGWVAWQPAIFGSIGIWLAAASAAALNHLIDRHADAEMARTKDRPLPQGQLSTRAVFIFALTLAVLSMLTLIIWVNVLTALLTFASMIGYAVIYTLYLKRATPQNIVIGGAAGAMPPILGWVAITNEIHPHSLLLFLIIFIWTPPHFWALAVNKREEYARVNIPMLPVTHGADFTRLHITLYTILLVLVTLLPYVVGMTGLIYLAGVSLLNARFLYMVFKLQKTKDDRLAMQTFVFSITYLMLLFAFLLIDHYFPYSLGFV